MNKKQKQSLRFSIKSALITRIFKGIRKELDDRIELLIKRNARMQNSSVERFYYKNRSFSNGIAIRPDYRDKLVPELKAEVDQYIKEFDALYQDEIPRISGFLVTVLNMSSNPKDYIDILPDVLEPEIRLFYISTEYFNNPRISKNEIDKFKKNNEHIINEIKIRMTKDLLL